MLLLLFLWNLSYHYNVDIGIVKYGITFRRTAYSIIWVWVITLAVNNKSELLRKYFWENRVLNFIGKLSYGIYLYHQYIYHADPYIISFINDRVVHQPALHDFLIGSFAMYLYNVTMLITLCWLSFTLIEKPIMNFKRFFKYS